MTSYQLGTRLNKPLASLSNSETSYNTGYSQHKPVASQDKAGQAKVCQDYPEATLQETVLAEKTMALAMKMVTELKKKEEENAKEKLKQEDLLRRQEEYNRAEWQMDNDYYKLQLFIKKGFTKW